MTPFSGLDPVNADAMRNAVLEIRRRGTTVVFSTHDMSAAERLCDRIFMIFKGNKVLDGTLDKIQSRYGQDTVRLRTAGGTALLDKFSEVEGVVDHGNFQDVRLKVDPQAFLLKLAASTAVYHFEIGADRAARGRGPRADGRSRLMRRPRRGGIQPEVRSGKPRPGPAFLPELRRSRRPVGRGRRSRVVGAGPEQGVICIR